MGQHVSDRILGFAQRFWPVMGRKPEALGSVEPVGNMGHLGSLLIVPRSFEGLGWASSAKRARPNRFRGWPPTPCGRSRSMNRRVSYRVICTGGSAKARTASSPAATRTTGLSACTVWRSRSGNASAALYRPAGTSTV